MEILLFLLPVHTILGGQQTLHIFFHLFQLRLFAIALDATLLDAVDLFPRLLLFSFDALASESTRIESLGDFLLILLLPQKRLGQIRIPKRVVVVGVTINGLLLLLLL